MIFLCEQCSLILKGPRTILWQSLAHRASLWGFSVGMGRSAFRFPAALIPSPQEHQGQFRVALIVADSGQPPHLTKAGVSSPMYLHGHNEKGPWGTAGCPAAPNKVHWAFQLSLIIGTDPSGTKQIFPIIQQCPIELEGATYKHWRFFSGSYN